MLKIVGYHPIILFIPTVGENPRIETAIKNARANFKEAHIVVWNDCCQSKKYFDMVSDLADDAFFSNHYVGPNRAFSFGLMYLDYAYFVLGANDMVLPQYYWAKIQDYQEKYKPDIIGENHRTKAMVEPVWATNEFYADSPLVISKRVVDDIGGFSPRSGMYSFGMIGEFQDRAFKNGLKVLIVRTGAENIAADDITYVRQNTPDGFIQGEMLKGVNLQENPSNQWWQA